MNITLWHKEISRQLAVTMLALLLSASIFMGLMPEQALAGVVCPTCLTSDKSVYTVGETPVIKLSNMAPNALIYWLIKFNSQTAFDNIQIGQTDASGNYTLDTGVFQDSDFGIYMLTAEAGSQQATIIFTVNPTPGDTKPLITGLTNLEGGLGETVTLYIEGKNFNGADSISGNGISPVSDRGFQLVTSKLISNFEIQATYSIAASATLGSRSITVTTAAGTSNAEDFTISATVVAPSPVITSISSPAVLFGTVVDVYGNNFPDQPAFATFYTNSQQGIADSVYSIQATRISGTQMEFRLEKSAQSVSFGPGSYSLSIYFNGIGSSDAVETNKVPFTISGAVVDPIGVIPAGTQAGDVVQFSSDPTVYLVQAVGLYPFENFYSYDLYTNQNNKALKKLSGSAASYVIQGLTASQQLNLANGAGQPFVPGTLVNYKGTIFLIIVGKQVPFHNFKAFQGLGYSLKNVINADLSQYNLQQTPGIGSANVPHTWGSWVKYNGTIYYSDESGLVGVPSYQIFLSNRGMPRLVLSANKYDIAVLKKSSGLLPLDYNDPRVEYSNIIDPFPQPIPPTATVDPKDARRLSDVRQLASALELYYNENNKYPNLFSDLIAPNYLTQLPQALTPPGGACTALQNSYIYTSLNNGTNYSLSFCLGGQAGGLNAGFHVVSSDGIN